MDKLAMISILVVTVAAPTIFARDGDARRGLRRSLLFLLLFTGLYVAYVTLIHTTYFQPPPWRW